MNRINRKDCELKYLGYTDIASLIAVGIDLSSGFISSKVVSYGGDYEIKAYIGENIDIPSFYTKVCEFKTWLKIYNDDGLTYVSPSFKYKPKFEIYRAGEQGTIINITKLEG